MADLQLWTPQQLYDEALDLGFTGYPRAIVVERAAYEAALAFQDGRAMRCLSLAEQLAFKQRLFYRCYSDLTEKPIGKQIRRRLTAHSV